MILRSRRWRFLLRVATLVLTSVLLLALAGPVSYALQDDTPILITGPARLSDKDRPVQNAYAHLNAVPDLAGAVGIREGSDTYYWIPLEGYGGLLYLRTKESRYLFPYDYNAATGFAPAGEVQYAGKVVALKDEIDGQKAVDALGAGGVAADKDKAMVLEQGEVPSAYRPMVPVVPVLAWLWLAALVGLVQIWRGRIKPKVGLSPVTRVIR